MPATVEDTLGDVMRFWAEGVHGFRRPTCPRPRGSANCRHGVPHGISSRMSKKPCCVVGGWAIRRSLVSRLRCPFPSALRSKQIWEMAIAMPDGSYSLGEAAAKLNMIRLRCEKCGRRGQYQTDRLLEQFGPNIAMPDLRHELAQCPHRGDTSNPCQVAFVDPLANL
jgi:hypothetical protein